MEVDETEGAWKGIFPRDVDRFIITSAVGVSDGSDVCFQELILNMYELEHCRNPLDRNFFPIAIAGRLSLVRRSWRNFVVDEIYPKFLLLSNYGMRDLTEEEAAELRFLQVTPGWFSCVKQKAVVHRMGEYPKLSRIDLKNVCRGDFYPLFHDDPFLLSAINPRENWSTITCVNFVLSIGESSIPSLLHLVGKFKNLEVFGLAITNLSSVAPDGEPVFTGFQTLSRLRLLHLDVRPYMDCLVIDHALVKWKAPRLDTLFIRALDNQLVLSDLAVERTRLRKLVCNTSPVPPQNDSMSRLTIPLPITTMSILHLMTSMVFKLFAGPYRFLEVIRFQTADFQHQGMPCFSRNDFDDLLGSLFLHEAVTEPLPTPSKLEALRCGRYPWAFYLTFFIWVHARDNVKKFLEVHFSNASFEDIREAKGDFREDGGDWLGVLKNFCDSPLRGTVVKLVDRSHAEL